MVQENDDNEDEDNGNEESLVRLATGSATKGMRFSQQVSRKGEVNSLSTRFVREDDQVVQSRRLRGQIPFEPMESSAPIYREPPVCLGLPARPPHQQRNAAAQEAAERVAFDEWLASVHGRFPLDSLSPFEHNLEVWRQLWRVIERSDVVCLVADVRNPLLHIPAALYDHCSAQPRLRIVIVLSKVDLISVEQLEAVRSPKRARARSEPARTSHCPLTASLSIISERRHDELVVIFCLLHASYPPLFLSSNASLLPLLIVLPPLICSLYNMWQWKAFLAKRFPRATLAEFSSKGRKVGGSMGGGGRRDGRPSMVPQRSAADNSESICGRYREGLRSRISGGRRAAGGCGHDSNAAERRWA